MGGPFDPIVRAPFGAVGTPELLAVKGAVLPSILPGRKPRTAFTSSTFSCGSLGSSKFGVSENNFCAPQKKRAPLAPTINFCSYALAPFAADQDRFKRRSQQGRLDDAIGPRIVRSGLRSGISKKDDGRGAKRCDAFALVESGRFAIKWSFNGNPSLAFTLLAAGGIKEV
jgi:hypothetical protein